MFSQLSHAAFALRLAKPLPTLLKILLQEAMLKQFTLRGSHSTQEHAQSLLGLVTQHKMANTG